MEKIEYRGFVIQDIILGVPYRDIMELTVVTDKVAIKNIMIPYSPKIHENRLFGRTSLVEKMEVFGEKVFKTLDMELDQPPYCGGYRYGLE